MGTCLTFVLAQASAATSAGRRSCAGSLSASGASSATPTCPALVTGHFALPSCSVNSSCVFSCLTTGTLRSHVRHAGKSECTRCKSATGRFCRACLLVRYGAELETVRAESEAGTWLCPHCYETDHPDEVGAAALPGGGVPAHSLSTL